MKTAKLNSYQTGCNRNPLNPILLNQSRFRSYIQVSRKHDNSAVPPSAESQETSVTDEQLLVRYRKTGERELFTQLVRRYERELYNYLRRYLGDPEMAEDAFQAAFLQVHLKCEQFEEGRRFRPWLYTIATNQAIDARRRNRRHVMISLDQSGRNDTNVDAGKLVDLLISDEMDPLDQVDAFELRERMHETLDELPEYMHTVIQLVYYQGMKYREAAEVLSIPVGTVKSRLHAAIHRLAEAWKATHASQL